jgi:adenylate kinase
MTHNTYAIILVGKSGSGKGTQGEFIRKYFQDKFPTKPFYEISTGKKFRDFQAGESYSAELSRKINEHGMLQPEFLAVWNWGTMMIEQIQKPGNIMFDGVPRRYDEALILDSAVKFFNFEKRLVIEIEVSNEECVKRMLERGRGDDNVDAIKKRLTWYERSVLPALDWYKTHRGYEILQINGEQSVEEIQKTIESYLNNWTA